MSYDQAKELGAIIVSIAPQLIIIGAAIGYLIAERKRT